MARFILILCLLAFPGLVFPQQGVTVSDAALKKVKRIRTAVDKFEWDEARNLSGKLIRQYPLWPEAWKVNAEVYRGSGDLLSSENALRRLVQLDSLHYAEAYRWIAEWTFNRGDYAGALNNFNRYLNLAHDTLSFPFPVKLLQSSIRFAAGQIRRKAYSQPVKLKGTVNTAADEYFPSLSVDGSFLVFTRQIKVPANKDSLTPQEDLFYVSFRDTSSAFPVAFPSPVNTTGNEGTQSLRQDGRIMFFTACNRPDTKGGCDIYYCVRSGDNWSNPVNLGYPVNSRYWESTPFLAPDGKRLFFASNRPGGYGGMDIWQSDLKPDRSWSAPRNLGQAVNTPLDEMSPIVLIDGRTLFFSSNGHPGMGGFDLFKYDLFERNRAVMPENLGYMINTCHNEDGLTVNAERNIGLFASNRDSITRKDIYQVKMDSFIPESTSLTLSGTVKDRITGLPAGARIDLQPHGDSLISSVESDPVTGVYLLGIPERPSYRIGASSPGYLPYSGFYVNDSTARKSRIHYDVFLEPVKTGATIILRNIFFAFDSYELLPGSDGDLQEILGIFNQNPGIVVEISGFTDSRGRDEYNLNLSQKRSETVMKYLTDHGVNSNQVSAKGYGRLNPVAANDNEEGRSLNRRTELKIIRLK